MKDVLISRATLIWLVLVCATAISLEIGHGGGGVFARRYAGAAIIVVAFVKVRFVILDFMEIRHAPLPMRIIAEGWVIVVCTALVTLFLAAPY